MKPEHIRIVREILYNAEFSTDAYGLVYRIVVEKFTGGFRLEDIQEILNDIKNEIS